jgi:glutaminyl-peptide cyclotransferase
MTSRRRLIGWVLLVASSALCTGTAMGARARGAAPSTLHDAFNAQQAFAYTARVAGFGERWPGSAGHRQTEALIEQTLRRDRAIAEDDAFTAATPRGPVPVRNLIGKFHVSHDPAQPIIILAGHYDTLFTRGFIGANDGGSSTAILLACADALAAHPTRAQVWLLWTDLEEAITQFSGGDGLYGSRHYAARLASSGIVPRVRGLFLLDMIGDRDLGVARETESSRPLQDIIAQAAGELGYAPYFFQYSVGIIDDHVPFIEAGIPAVDVVDARFGRMGPDVDGMGAFHHSTADTMDKVSARSLDIVGRTMLRTVELLDARR